MIGNRLSSSRTTRRGAGRGKVNKARPRMAAIPAPTNSLGKLTDDTLMTLVKFDDNAAWGELFSRYQRPLHLCLRPLLPDSSTTDDMVSETFLRIRLKSYTYNGQSFKPWLFTIGRRVVYDFYRRMLTRRETSLDTGDAGTDLIGQSLDCLTVLPAVWVGRDEVVGLTPNGAQATNDLVNAITALSDNYKLAMFLTCFGGLTLMECGLLLVTPPAAIASARHRFRVRMRYLRHQKIAGETRLTDGTALRAELRTLWRRLVKTPLGLKTKRRAEVLGMTPRWQRIEQHLADGEYWL